MTKIIPLLMKRNTTLPLGVFFLSSLLAIGFSSIGQVAQAGEPQNAPAI
jgi:hypothetical protein